MPKKKEAIREYKIDGRIFISGPHKRKMTIEVKEGEKTDIILMRLNQSLRRLMYQLGLDWRGQMGWCKNPACHKAVFLEGWKIAKIMREKEKRLG